MIKVVLDVKVENKKQKYNKEFETEFYIINRKVEQMIKTYPREGGTFRINIRYCEVNKMLLKNLPVVMEGKSKMKG